MNYFFILIKIFLIFNFKWRLLGKNSNSNSNKENISKNYQKFSRNQTLTPKKNFSENYLNVQRSQTLFPKKNFSENYLKKNNLSPINKENQLVLSILKKNFHYLNLIDDDKLSIDEIKNSNGNNSNIKIGKFDKTNFIIKKIPNELYLNEYEITNILNDVDNLNTVRLYGNYKYKENNYLVFKKYEGDLKQYLTKNIILNDQILLKNLKVLKNSLDKIHNLNIYHRDLKLENIFLEKIKDELKFIIGDFGSSIKIDNNNTKIIFETSDILYIPMYMVPINNYLDEYEFNWSESKIIDNFALGMIGYLAKNFDDKQIKIYINSDGEDDVRNKQSIFLKNLCVKENLDSYDDLYKFIYDLICVNYIKLLK